MIFQVNINWRMMGSRPVLANREDVRMVEAEEQLNFVLSVLHASGVSEEKLQACLTDGLLASVENKIAFRKICEKEQISIIDDSDGGVKLYMKSDNQDVLVAEWFKPSYILRTDHSVLDRSKKMFIEIHTHWWTVFEENDGKEK